MKLCVEIPEGMLGNEWPEEILTEGADMCWHSDNVDGLEEALSFMSAISNILGNSILEEHQQAYMDEKMKEYMP